MPGIKSKQHQIWINNVLGSLDVIITLFTLLIACIITNKYTSESVIYDIEFLLILFFVTSIWVILLNATNLARIPRTSAIPVIVGDFVRLTLLGGSIILILDYLIKIDSFPSISLAIFILLNFFSLVFFRLISFKVFRVFRAKGHNIRNLVIIADETSEIIIDKILQHKDWGYKILHIISDSKKIREKYSGIAKVFPRSVNVKSIIRYDIIDELICCKSDTCSNKLYELVEYCHNTGIKFRIQGKPNFLTAFKTRVQYLDRLPFSTIINSPSNSFGQILKLILEIIFAFFILFLFSPVFIVIPFLIAIFMEGPVIIKEKRVGLRGRKFYMYKFRTHKLTNDLNNDTTESELTSLGVFLIKTHAFKIPQLFNVIRGEMSIIGPRAPLQTEVDNYQDWHFKRLSVKPGIIYSWEYLPINGNSEAATDKVKQDIYYIENWSLKSDIGLFFRTFKTAIFARS